MAMILTPAGDRDYTQPAADGVFTLAEMQAIVGGYIEIVPSRIEDGMVLVVNEDGKLLGLPANALASGHCPGDVLVGNVLLCTRKEAGFNDA